MIRQRVGVYVVTMTVAVWLGLLTGCNAYSTNSGGDQLAPRDSVPEDPKTNSGAIMKCRYRKGDTDLIQYTAERQYRSWLEMPDKPRRDIGQKSSHSEIVLRRTIESVDPNGTAIMKVAFETVSLLSKVSGKEQRTMKYLSTAAQTVSDWADDMALAGVSFKVRIAPDTTVIKIMDLDKLQAKLIEDEQTSIISWFIAEEQIHAYLQRDFVRHRQGDETEYQGAVTLPDSMMKAQALNKLYQVTETKEQGASRLVTVDISGEPLMILPEGIPQPPAPEIFTQVVIKNNSQMNEFSVTGRGVFDLTARKPVRDKTDVLCMLILENDTLFKKAGKPEKDKKGGGIMFVEVKVNTLFELIE